MTQGVGLWSVPPKTNHKLKSTSTLTRLMGCLICSGEERCWSKIRRSHQTSLRLILTTTTQLHWRNRLARYWCQAITIFWSSRSKYPCSPLGRSFLRSRFTPKPPNHMV